MKKTVGWFLVAALAFSTHALAAPLYSPFLAVDINGGQGVYGPTQPVQAGEPANPGWQGWNVNDGDLFGTLPITVTKSFPTAGVASGSVNVSMTAVGVSGTARLRSMASSEPWGDMQRDFVMTTRNTSGGFGRHYFQFDFSGLDPNKSYEITMFNFDPNSSQTGNDRGYMAWGIQNPATWLDTNVGTGQSYQPAVGGVSNPIPTLARVPDTGPWPSQSGAGGTFSGGFYYYSGSFVVTANGAGAASVYGWSDPNSYNSQTASLVNGFQISPVPEPTAIVLVGLGVVGLVANRRRS